MMCLVLVLAIALQAASFSYTGQGDVKHFEDQSPNPVTSMSFLVRRIIKTRVSKKNETPKMKFKRRSKNVS
jgi:hypothetical protein